MPLRVQAHRKGEKVKGLKQEEPPRWRPAIRPRQARHLPLEDYFFGAGAGAGLAAGAGAGLAAGAGAGLAAGFGAVAGAGLASSFFGSSFAFTRSLRALDIDSALLNAIVYVHLPTVSLNSLTVVSHAAFSVAFVPTGLKAADTLNALSAPILLPTLAV